MALKKSVPRTNARLHYQKDSISQKLAYDTYKYKLYVLVWGSVDIEQLLISLPFQIENACFVFTTILYKHGRKYY